MGSQDGRVYAWSLDDLSQLKRSPAQNDYVDTIAIIPKIKKLHTAVSESVSDCGASRMVAMWNFLL